MRSVASWTFVFAASGYPLVLATEAVDGVLTWVVFAVGILVIGFVAILIYPEPVRTGRRRSR